MARCAWWPLAHHSAISNRGFRLEAAPNLAALPPFHADQVGGEEGSLFVFASDPEAARRRLRPLFDAVGERTICLGEAGAGTRLKLATNSWLIALIEGAAETLAFAEGVGIEPRQVLDAISGGPLDMPYLQMKGKAMIERSFEPSFRLALAAKDARLVQEAAADSGLDLPLIATIRRRMEQAAEEHGDEDLAAVYLRSRPSQKSA